MSLIVKCEVVHSKTAFTILCRGIESELTNFRSKALRNVVFLVAIKQVLRYSDLMIIVK